MDASAILVKQDGLALGAGAVGSALPADPGEHVVEVSSSGYVTWTGAVKLGPDGDRQLLEVPPLAPIRARAPIVVKTPPAPAPAAAPSHKPANGSSRRYAAAFILGGAGVVALGLGAYFGVHTLQEMSDAKNRCPVGGPSCHDPLATAESSDASTSANVANVGIAVGLVSMGAAAYLLLTKPDPADDTTGAASARRPGFDVAVSPRGASFSYGGAF
jgi:hypothetical protein